MGMEGKSLRRNAPSLFNVAYETKLFLDGREKLIRNSCHCVVMSRFLLKIERDVRRGVRGYAAFSA